MKNKFYTQYIELYRKVLGFLYTTLSSECFPLGTKTLFQENSLHKRHLLTRSNDVAALLVMQFHFIQFATSKALHSKV